MTRNDLIELATIMGVQLDLIPDGSLFGCYSAEHLNYVRVEQYDDSPKMQAAALHELGHIAHKHISTDRDLTEPLETEAEAWRWAFDHGAVLTPEVRELVNYAMSTYYDGFDGKSFFADPRKPKDGGPLGPASEWLFDNVL